MFLVLKTNKIYFYRHLTGFNATDLIIIFLRIKIKLVNLFMFSQFFQSIELLFSVLINLIIQIFPISTELSYCVG